MTALREISDALATLPPPGRGLRRFVIVGSSAMKALEAEAAPLAGSKQKLTRLGDYPLIPTEDFRGWEITDRPA